MTKKVRIENADTADHQVDVEIWDKGYPAGEPDVLVRTVPLDYPTAMTDDGVYLTSTRYIVVRERPAVIV